MSLCEFLVKQTELGICVQEVYGWGVQEVGFGRGEVKPRRLNNDLGQSLTLKPGWLCGNVYPAEAGGHTPALAGKGPCPWVRCLTSGKRSSPGGLG